MCGGAHLRVSFAISSGPIALPLASLPMIERKTCLLAMISSMSWVLSSSFLCKVMGSKAPSAAKRNVLFWGAGVRGLKSRLPKVLMASLTSCGSVVSCWVAGCMTWFRGWLSLVVSSYLWGWSFLSRLLMGFQLVA